MDLQYCYAGLDLAATNDFNAASFLFPPTYGQAKPLLTRYFWIPEAKAEQRIKNNPSFKKWEDEGYLEITPGNVTDYDYIRAVFNKIRDRGIDIRVIAFDPAYSYSLIPGLISDGFTCEKFSQSLMSMGPMVKELEKLLISGEIMHDGSPVSRWMYGNVELYMGPNDLYRPIKNAKKQENKIDGVVADIMAVGQWKAEDSKPKAGSYLFEEGAKLIAL